MLIESILQTNAALPGTLARWETSATAPLPDEACRSVAADIVKTRRLRQRYLSDFHLADPVWDILLDLYVAETRGRQLSILDLALATSVPRSTGVRWVTRLIAEGKLERSADTSDGRRSMVTMSAATRSSLERYLNEIARLGIKRVETSDHVSANMSQYGTSTASAQLTVVAINNSILPSEEIALLT